MFLNWISDCTKNSDRLCRLDLKLRVWGPQTEAQTLSYLLALTNRSKYRYFLKKYQKRVFRKKKQNAQPCFPAWSWKQNELSQTQGSSSEERMVAFLLSLDRSDTYKRILTSFELMNLILIQLNCGFFISRERN